MGARHSCAHSVRIGSRETRTHEGCDYTDPRQWAEASEDAFVLLLQSPLMPDDYPRGRPSLRLPTYDYSQPGGYFVTICTLDRICLFGQVTEGTLRLTDAGHMVGQIWEELPQRFGHISLDASITMPNHFHGIVIIQEHRARQGLGQIIGAFKSLTTNRYIVGVRRSGWERFTGRLWQDNYFEHVIRNEASLKRIREYIANNPAQWETDPERPMEGIK